MQLEEMRGRRQSVFQVISVADFSQPWKSVLLGRNFKERMKTLMKRTGMMSSIQPNNSPPSNFFKPHTWSSVGHKFCLR